MRAAELAIIAAITVINPRQINGFFRCLAKRCPVNVQKRHTKRLVIENPKNRRAASAQMLRLMENPAEAARATAHTFGFTTWKSTASTNVNGRSRSCACARDAFKSFHVSHRIQSAEITLMLNSTAGSANRMLCTPKTLATAKRPVPIGTPIRCGRVARNPNLAPDVVSITTLGPGEKSPAKINRNRGREAVRIHKTIPRLVSDVFRPPVP